MFRRAYLLLWLAALAGAALAASSAGQGPPGGSPPGLDKAIAAKQKHAERLLDKPGVAGVAVGLNPAGKPVIRIYKEKDDVEDLPTDLEGVPVETTTTGVIEPYDHLPTHRYPRPVPIGISAGLAGVATGTLGVRVTNGTNTYALSNNHVFAGVNTANIGDPIISPGDADGGSDPADRIGTLAAYQEIDFSGGINTMDAAIALTSTSNVGIATPADGYGLPSPNTAQAFIGQGVQKYGRTTGFQQGSVAGTNVSVDVCYIGFENFCLQEARFAGQISISPGPFSAPGDSGSLVVTQGGNEPVGLLFAGGDGLTIATPIDLVLQRFGVTIEGAPPDGSPSAPTAFSALAGDASASLSWNAPSFDGGSPVSGYKVYRDTSPNPTTVLDTLGVQTSYVDPGLQNGTTYYYKVSALNANGESPLSNQSKATPSALVAPVDPLPIVDSFNRPNENPLSDAGRWTNGDQRLGRVRPVHDIEHSCLHEDLDLHVLAQHRPLRPRHRGVGAHHDAARYEQPVAPARPHPAAGNEHVRRLHAAPHPACGNRSGPPRAGRQRRDRQPPDGQPGARGRRRLPAAGQGLDGRGLAPRRLGLVAAGDGVGLHLCAPPATSASGYVVRPAARTTSESGRWALRPTPRRRPRPRT